MNKQTKNILMALAALAVVLPATETSARGRHHHRGYPGGYYSLGYRLLRRTPVVYTTPVVYPQQPAVQVQTQPVQTDQVQQPAVQVQQPATRVVYSQPVVVPAPLPATVAGVDAVGGTATFGTAEAINTVTTRTNRAVGSALDIVFWPLNAIADALKPAPVCPNHARKVCHKCIKIERAKQKTK